MNKELHELNAQMIAQEYVDELIEEVTALKAYKEENEDFQKAWQELKEENDKLQGLYQDEHCMNLELGKIIECKNGTIATLAKTRDTLKEDKLTYKEKTVIYQQTLSEIRDIASWHISDMDSYDIQNDMKDIINKIDEVLKLEK